MGVVNLGKGSARRPSAITREEEELRWKLANGHITFEQFEQRYKELLKAGKIQRNGRVVKNA